VTDVTLVVPKALLCLRGCGGCNREAGSLIVSAAVEANASSMTLELPDSLVLTLLRDLFDGKIWINIWDLAIVKITAAPPKAPRLGSSRWVLSEIIR
jgi:hypothetical protein